ncbi:MAG: hypothetical protein N3B12_03660 [Armatimonadetes bacterium]|nr:hypothetical protein [Armatimonadota bacterium]
MKTKLALAVLLCLLVLVDGAWSDDVSPTSEIDELKARISDLEQKLEKLQEQQATTQGSEPSAETGSRYLALPDISLIVQAKGKATSDKLDPAKQKIQLTEAELGIQGYVYPNVRADAFFAGSPAEHQPFQIHEAYLTYLGVAKGLNFTVGQKFVPFDRVNQLHNHSWLYARQPLVLTNFVAHESLAGQGALLSYLIPTRSNVFAQFDLGVWANGTEGEESDYPPNIQVGPGASLTDRFETARVWIGIPTGENGELEIGGSRAGGKSEQDPDTGLTNYVHLKGLDVTYRWFGQKNSRLLLRGEYLWRKGTTDSNAATAKGYYLFANYRFSRYFDVGLLYDWSQFPQDVSQKETAISVILTRQFSEQYYLRLHATRGSRPNATSYSEIWLHWCWGVGPHTHKLE